MPTLEFNGQAIEARQGETLVEAARRHGSYVWFLCDGRGICQTCECRVISGAENLSGLTELERAGLAEQRRASGYRLGCQARLVGPGPLSVISRAEELRRRIWDAVRGQSSWAELQKMGTESLSATVDVLTGVAMVSPHAIPQILKHPPTPARMARYTLDTMRLVGRLFRITGR